MRCDTCITLRQAYTKFDILLRVASGKARRKRTHDEYSFTAKKHQASVKLKRKVVLCDIVRRFKDKRRQLAADQSDLQGKDVDPMSIHLDDVVPDEDVETERFCKLLNEGFEEMKSTNNINNISDIDVFISEMLDLDDEAAEAYICGYMHQDFSLGPRDPSLDNLLDDDDMYEDVGDDGDDGDVDVMDWSRLQRRLEKVSKSTDPQSSRGLFLLTALQRLIALRSFHNEHVV